MLQQYQMSEEDYIFCTLSNCEVAASVRMLGGHQGGKSALGSHGPHVELIYPTLLLQHRISRCMIFRVKTSAGSRKLACCSCICRREYGARDRHEDRIRSCLAKVASVLLLLSFPRPQSPSFDSTTVTVIRQRDLSFLADSISRNGLRPAFARPE
jgi:hypothetical protein